MARRGHPSDPIFKKYDVSKDKLSVDDLLPLRKAIQKVVHRSMRIGRALGIPDERLTTIGKMHNEDRSAIAVLDSWLRGNVNKSSKPYSLHTEEKYRCPSWWNLVWAVAHGTGGDNPAHALVIAQSYKGWSTSADPKYSFNDADTTTLNNIDDVTDELQGVWPKWYEIGVALKMATSDLDIILKEQSEVVEQFRAMIKKWVVSNAADEDDPPCWRKLLGAVAVPHGGDNFALANDLASQHGGSGGSEAAGEGEAMEVGTTTAEEPGQGHDGFKFDSASPQSPFPPQVSFPASLPQVMDDSGGSGLSKFIVYSRNAHKSGDGKKPHGLALIVSNEMFDAGARLSNRICSPWDDKRLTETLEALGYRVVLKKNQTAAEIVGHFESIRLNRGGELQIKAEDDSFIFCISSHGDWDGEKNTDLIYGRDRGKVYLHKVVYEKLNTIDCPHLGGKPKLFFVQACRGAGYGRIAPDSGDTKVPPAPQLPRESDFFISYSTAPETKSFRFDPNRPRPEGGDVDTSTGDPVMGYKIGSFYITELCNALTRYAPKLDLMTIVLTVHQNLQATDSNVFAVELRGGREVKTRQCPHLTTSLRGPVFFYNDAEKNFLDYVKGCK